MNVGDLIPPIQKTVYQRSLAQRKWSEDSIHNDNYTKGLGYPGALVSAYVLAGYASEPLVRLFGESWFTTGQHELKFVGKGVQQGDQVTIGGVITGVEDLGAEGQRLSLDLWIEKDGGVRPVLGTATGVLKTPSA